jgi:hypothetical protein
MFIPFLGTAYSRACEFTCDRYGFQAPSDPTRGLDGLCILAAGPQYVSMVDREAFAAQRRDLDTVFMRLGGWFATHPPLAQRIAALDANLELDVEGSITATLGALLVALLIMVVPLVGGAFALKQVADDAVNKFAAQTGAGKGSLRPGAR